MKQRKKLGGKLLALLLVLCIGVSLFPVAPVLAQEEDSQSAAEASAEPADGAEEPAPAENQPEAAEAYLEDTTGGETSADLAISEENTAEGETPAVVSPVPEGSAEEAGSAVDSTTAPGQPEDSVAEEDSLAEDMPEGIDALDDVDGETLAPSEADAFRLDVTFAGQTLQEKRTNAISGAWDVTTAQSLNVVLKRDTTVKIDETKQYVLCLKVSEGFSFDKLPEIDKLDGAQDMAFVQNKASGDVAVDPYSGEIRIRINPETETVNLGTVEVTVSDALAAAAGTGLTVQSPVRVQLITADASLTLKDMLDSDKTLLHGDSVDSVYLVDTSAPADDQNAGGQNESETAVPDGIEPLDDETGSEVVTPREVNEKSAFDVSVSFAGRKLTEGGTNAIADEWSGNSSKIMQVTITRNKSYDVDPNKQYVLCMKTSDVFYFNGLPDVSTITGAEDVAIVKNETPKINVVGKTQEQSLMGFSPYSGEIRVKLNPAVDVITIADIGVSYNSALMGYTDGEQTVTDPVDVQLISVDASETLSGFKDTNKVSLQDFPVSTLKVKTEKVGGGLRTFNSIDDFKSNTIGADAKLNVDDGISYVLGSQKQKEMVYGTLTCVLHVPYIIVNGEKKYLKFDENDTAITDNKKGTSIGYPMKNPAVYNAEAHTITYTFENVYMVSWSNFAYTPTFRWPDGVEKNITADCNVEGYMWEISEQKTFTGATGSISKSSTAKGTVFRPNQADIKLWTDYNQSALKIAKPMIYRDVNRQTGISGFLGYFDVHNEGAGDSPEVKVKIEFNTSDDSDAKYYVTQVQIPADQAKTTVTYTLVDDSGVTVTGTYTYNNTTSFSCKVGELRQNSGVDDNYFIQSLEYQTILRRNKYYHTDVTHNYRNAIGTPGSYQGYIDGTVGAKASAKMTISAVDENGKITSDGKTELTATEISTISDLDFISTGIYGATLDNQSSTNITAGSSTKLQFTILVGSEEYGLSERFGVTGPPINGYHVLRDGIFYACLPEGVSILGADQVKVEYSRKSIPATSVQVLENTKCTVNGATAYWWKIVVPQMNVNAFVSATATISIDLATSESMAGVSWNFNDCLALGTNGQKLSRVNDSFTNGSNTVAGLKNLNLPSANGLVNALDPNADNLGINLYRSNSSVILNIARAEAKLDVTTALSVNDTASTNDQVTVSDKNTKITYAVTVTGQESGAAEDFDYYIPIVHTDSTLDTGALVSQKEIGLELSEAVQITSVGGTAGEELPFEVFYTTDSGLNSTTIQGNTVKWVDTLTDYSKVTAVKISTRPNARVNEKEAYRFDVVMQYDDSANDFDRQAGSVAHWRSFGHYTYVRNNATTTNSYPSASNSVKIRYVKDLTGTPMTLKLDTAAATNSVDTDQMLGTTFVKAQKLSIKAVTPSSGTQLISDDPTALTGADANSRFKVSFNINNATSAVTLPSVHSAWSIPANTNVNLQTKVFFSKALTDVTTERYVDLVLGNDDVDITCRVKLERKVTAASATGSGVAVGEQFQVPKVAESCSISQDSAFTALYVIENFVPGNYSGQLLKWQNSSGTDSSFPAGTTITMMEVNEDSQITGYWYCKPSGSSVNLSSFTRMAGTEKYSYDTSATAGTTLRYLFVVNFGQASASAGSYQLAFDATAKAGVTAFTPVALGVTLGATKSYGLSATTTADVLNPTADVSYTVTDASGNDSYTEGKSLSLVLTPQNAAGLPQDARIQVGDQTYSCNGENEIIIPIGTIAAGSKTLTLTSKMFPEEEKTYSFTAKLYLSNSAQADAPSNGTMLTSYNLAFEKTAENRPALSVTGTRVATVSDWASGQTIDIQMKNLDDCDVTVKVYSGVSGTTQVTDLVSSVSGIFTMNSGTGVYNKGIPTGKLVLNSAAKAGTYRLSFEVSKAGKVLLTVPYYVIVR